MTAALSPARRAALHTLEVARERNGYVRELLNSEAGERGRAGLLERDAAFAERLALGVTATWGTLDEILDRFLRRPDSLDASVRDALRISTFEMLFLNKESHAAVSQGVELVKTRAKSAAGLANAVLRRVSEAAPAFMAESAAHRYGLPTWLCERISNELGPQALELFGQAGLTQAPAYLANVPRLLSDEDTPQAFREQGIEVRAAGVIPGAWCAQDAAKAVTCDLVTGHDVRAIVCDLGAQTVAYLAAPSAGDRMLEVGSGRGTKSILMAGQLRRRAGADASARVWALDVHKSRGRVAQDRLVRAGIEGVTQVTGDARHLDSVAGLPPHFDRILVDAPCSGTGTLRRHPEITWSLTPEGVHDLARMQLEMLAECASRLMSGGILCYATCSVLTEEDEDVVESFLDTPAGTEFEIVRPRELALNDAARAELDAHTSPDGYLRTMVREGGCDGHFCACLKRK